MEEVNFSGNRAAMVFVNHDFEQRLFRGTGLPLIRSLPFTVSVHGGAFWTDFVDHTPNTGDEAITTAPSAYVELGFGLGNLTPWLTPLNLAVWFTWQVSEYATDRFVFRLGVPAL